MRQALFDATGGDKMESSKLWLYMRVSRERSTYTRISGVNDEA